MKKTKIICSIGPASNTYETMLKMVEAGMNIARINFSHATLEERQTAISVVERIRKENNKFVGILYDTKGPEFRSGMQTNDSIELVEGKTIRIVKEKILGTEEAFSVNHSSAIESINVGNVILIENDLMKLEVISKEEDGITCKILTGGTLGNKKSMAVPGIKLDIPFVSEEDYEDIVYACEHTGDYLALSFVSTREDILEVKEILKKYNREDLKIIAKIENITGVNNVVDILEECDGVMVARGDLGVEVPLEELPYIQRELVRKCRENGKAAIVATEMLESMKKNSRPTRAEASDVAYAVMNGTDAVMLSGETTTGKYPVETVTHMAAICEQNEKHLNYNNVMNYNYKHIIPNTVALAIKSASTMLDAKVIVAATLSGYTARKISNLRPKSFICAACPSEKIANGLSLYFGVYPTIVPYIESTDELLEQSKDLAVREYDLVSGDRIILTGGRSKSDVKSPTNFMTIEEI